MKRVFAIILAVLLVLGLGACTQQPSPTTAATTEPTTVATTQVPTTTEKPVDLSLRPFALPGTVTLTIGLMENGTVRSYEENYVTRYLELETGIDLQFVLFPMDYKKAQEQLLQMVSVFISDEFSTASLRTMAASGIHSIWCEGDILYHTDTDANLSLQPQENMTYTKVYAGS
jgi:ABC-type glycerol-3-phosphate transport system substrate-binding protein